LTGKNGKNEDKERAETGEAEADQGNRDNQEKVIKKKLVSRVVRGRDDIVIPASAIVFQDKAGGRKRRYVSLAAPTIHTTPVRCHHCLAVGHMHKYCPLRYCRLCDMYSHTAKQCFRNQGNSPKLEEMRGVAHHSTGKLKKKALQSRGHHREFKWRSKVGNRPIPFGTAGL